MTGPDERDDVDDVTLWAGRLRPWPAAPVSDGADSSDEVDDETVLSPRTVDDATVLSPSTVDDETVRSTGVLDDETVVSRSTLDDTTLHSPVRPAGTTAPTAGDDGGREDRELESGLDGGEFDDDTAVGACASARGAVPPVDDDTAPRAGAAEPPASRSALRRDAEDPIVGDAARRQARRPGVDDLRRYTPRADDAVRVPRAEKPVRADAGAAPTVVPRSGRRGSIRLLVGGGILALALIGAVVALAVLAL